jgi:uncharacterized membrane protein YccC
VLTLAGGVLAILVHMSGAIVDPRAPEKRAVAAAAQSIIDFISAAQSPREAVAQHYAAAALHHAWSILVTYQPIEPQPGTTLHRLRVINRRLNQLFAAVNGRLSRHEDLPNSMMDEARLLARQAQQPTSVAEPDEIVTPLGHFGGFEALRQSVAPASPQFRVALRAGLATFLAGAIASELGLERAYWTMAAAVLMLHQGLDLVRTLQRGLERMLGTWAGLIIAWGVISLRPTGLWLAVTLMAFQFLIELFVLRNYAIAVAFITPVALTIAAGGHALSDLHHLLIGRGVDTTLGCVIALLVLVLTTTRQPTRGIRQVLRRAITAAEAVLSCLAEGSVTDTPAKMARRDLQYYSLALLQAYEDSVGASIRDRDMAETGWPAVVAWQRLAYHILALCWQTETCGLNAAETTAIRQAQRELATIDIGSAIPSAPLSNLRATDLLAPDIAALREAIAMARLDCKQ